jgi:hypothetical protein
MKSRLYLYAWFLEDRICGLRLVFVTMFSEMTSKIRLVIASSGSSVQCECYVLFCPALLFPSVLDIIRKETMANNNVIQFSLLGHNFDRHSIGCRKEPKRWLTANTMRLFWERA